MALNLGDLLAEAGNVPISGTKRELVDLKLSELHSDPKNFYSLEGIEDLAANIELVGLQQPILVRPDGDGYMVISGHRRKAALELLTKEGKGQFSTVPCFIQREQRSEAWQELCLIYGNASTRKLSNYDLSQQAERVQELFYQLKEEGVEFPGRMRDHVAEACKVTKSKLSRLKVINDGLVYKAAVEEWQSGRMNEAAAYALARLPDWEQKYICLGYVTNGYKLHNISEGSVVRAAEVISRVDTQRCKLKGPCNMASIKVRRYFNCGTCYECARGCCAECSQLARCSDACVYCGKEKEAAALKAKESRAQAAAEKKATEAPEKSALYESWLRMGEVCKWRSVDFEEVRDECELYTNCSEETAQTYLDGLKENMPLTVRTPLELWPRDVLKIRNICRRLNISADYLLGLTDEMRELEPEGDPDGD